MSPADLIVRLVLLPALVARLLRAPLFEAERALGTGSAPARTHGVARPSTTTRGATGDGIELKEMGEASGGTRVAPSREVSEAIDGDYDAYGCDDGTVHDSANPMHKAV